MRDIPTDPSLGVDGLPRSIKGKITELIEASVEWAFIGAKYPDDHNAIEENLVVARYNLEKTIKTLLDLKK